MRIMKLQEWDRACRILKSYLTMKRLCSIWEALVLQGKPFGKHWSNPTFSFYQWATLGRHFLPVGPSQVPFLHHCDTFVGINLIKIGGSFEEISLVRKPFLYVSRANYSVYHEFPLSKTTDQFNQTLYNITFAQRCLRTVVVYKDIKCSSYYIRHW